MHRDVSQNHLILARLASAWVSSADLAATAAGVVFPGAFSGAAAFVAEGAGFDGAAVGFDAESADLDTVSPAFDGVALVAGFDATEVTFVESLAVETFVESLAVEGVVFAVV